ncbi:heme exporter protein CcmD [Celeribacter neptunius]
MPDLGKYAGDVLMAYGITIALLVLLIWRSLARSAKVKRQLKDAEERRKTHG